MSPGELSAAATVGSGLGLAIVQAIAAAHGGYARLRSAPGAGTTVQVWIPVRSPASYAERDHASGPSSPRLVDEWLAGGQAAAPEPAASPRA